MDSVSSNIDSITVDAVSEIQRILHPYDLRSLVFLLYDTPYTALERLTLLQRVSGKNIDSLDDWAKQAKARSVWRYEFLEALSICQLYGIIRKLGFNVNSVKLHFLPNNLNVNIYINPMKKALYKLCENMTSDNFIKFKNSLFTFNIDVKDCEACELVLLELMCRKFIIVRNNTEKDLAVTYEIEKLTRIVENLSGLQQIAKELKEIEIRLNKPILPVTEPETSDVFEEPEEQNQCYEGNFSDLAEICANITDEDINFPKFKIDSTKLIKESYPIIKNDRVGVCYIINQQEFYPSKESMEQNNCEPLENRPGSKYDRDELVNTMKSFNFKVIVHENLKHNQIHSKIKDTVKYVVHNDDSVFILCILSHGIEGCIYSSDSIPVEVRDIKNILDSENASNLYGKPKVLIIEACQGNLKETFKLVADAPTENNRNIRKVDFLTLWATVPEYSAYRDDNVGSIFIQYFCKELKKSGDTEHLVDIYYKVNDKVIKICEKHKCQQVLHCDSTLRKKLYLKLPSL